MKKIILLVPLFILLATTFIKKLDDAFLAKKIVNPLSHFVPREELKQLVHDSEKSVAKMIVTENKNQKKYQVNDFVPKITKVKNSDQSSLNKNVKISKVISKKIPGYKLQKKDKNSNNKIVVTKNNFNDYIVELDINEKIKTSAHTQTSTISGANWTIFEYSLEHQELSEENTLAQIEATPTIKIDLAENTDRISTALAATEKSNVNESLNDEEIQVDVVRLVKENQQIKNVETKTIESNVDEIVFFDYSKANNQLENKNEKAKLAALQKKKQNDSSSEILAIAPIEPQVKKVNGPIGPDLKIFENDKTESKSDNVGNRVEYSISPYSVDGKQNKKMITQFDVRFDDDIDEVKQSYGENTVKFNLLTNNQYGVRRSTIFANGHYPTAIDIIVENQKETARIPLIQYKYLSELYSKINANGLGATILVELDASTEDVDLDTKYEKKIYLDHNLRFVERSESDYSFIMFIGAEAGNTIINFKSSLGNGLSKIIHIKNDEIYYEPNFYLNNEIDQFTLFEEYLLTKDQTQLSLDPAQIRGLTFNNKLKKITNNKYRLDRVVYPLGMRSYLELKHLEESVYVGRWGNEKVIVPSEEYIRYVLDQFKLNKVSSNCLVQLNLSKSASELNFNGQSKNGNMRMQVKILDNDGIFYTDLSKESKKVFMLGEEQGIISIKIKYYDGTEDYLQSYCSDSTYLVEQL
jgi:hypothetical protein